MGSKSCTNVRLPTYLSHAVTHNTGPQDVFSDCRAQTASAGNTQLRAPHFAQAAAHSNALGLIRLYILALEHSRLVRGSKQVEKCSSVSLCLHFTLLRNEKGLTRPQLQMSRGRGAEVLVTSVRSVSGLDIEGTCTGGRSARSVFSNIHSEHTFINLGRKRLFDILNPYPVLLLQCVLLLLCINFFSPCLFLPCIH